MVSLARPRVMAIVNATPDSFFAGSRGAGVAEAVAMAARAAAAGAAVLDIGGESTRPGAASVPENEQLRRVVPVIEELRRLGVKDSEGNDIAISVDTTRAAVARAALEAGADAVNDVSAGLDDEAMLGVVARAGAGVVLMHRAAAPARDAYSDAYAKAPHLQAPHYDDVVETVRGFLEARMGAALAAGVDAARILLDPGLGFGKTVEQNLRLIRETPRLLSLGRPILSALSRKSFVGRTSLGRDSSPDERLMGTVAMSVLHIQFGARLLRVHDVPEHVEAVEAAWALCKPMDGGR